VNECAYVPVWDSNDVWQWVPVSAGSARLCCKGRRLLHAGAGARDTHERAAVERRRNGRSAEGAAGVEGITNFMASLEVGTMTSMRALGSRWRSPYLG
jgi:hypothetical protein